VPISFYEKDENVLYNSVAVLDCGKLLGIYRKTHIPDDHFYQEKFYFTPGNTGFRVWDTTYGRIGVGICWDQWFPETARCMALLGADLLLYPTAVNRFCRWTAQDTGDVPCRDMLPQISYR
jgi:N-carbamoylputrescine amidase